MNMRRRNAEEDATDFVGEPVWMMMGRKIRPCNEHTGEEREIPSDKDV